MQQIDLDLDKENELVFKLSIEGTKPAIPKSRFLLESNDFSLVFPSKSHTGGEVTILIPSLENILKEGSYVGTLEVIIDDRVFTPIQINTKFEKSISVIAEAVMHKKKETQVSVSPVVTVNRKNIETKKENHNHIVKESILSDNTPRRRDAPPQRNRTRPRQNNRKSIQKIPSKILESNIRKIASQKGVQLSESQIKEIIKKYTNSNRREV